MMHILGSVVHAVYLSLIFYLHVYFEKKTEMGLWECCILLVENFRRYQIKNDNIREFWGHLLQKRWLNLELGGLDM